MTQDRDRVVAVIEREWRTLRRSRSYLGLAAGFTLLLVAIAVFSGATAFVPLALTLLTPVELVVPALAAAFGYRPILGDRARGELAVLRTYPIKRYQYVAGVYLGRLAALLVIVVGGLLLVGVAVPIVGGASTFLPQPAGLDSPLLYLRFVVLTGVFSSVVLAVMTVLSAVAGTHRQALVLGILIVLLFAIGVDLATIVGVGSFGDSMAMVVAVSPNGAYRGLVLTLVVKPVTTTPLASTAPLLSVGSLLLWLIGPLGGAIIGVWHPLPRY